MTKEEKIRAEIERRYNERVRIGDNIRANVHKSLISFIDSMQEEPVSEELTDAVNKYCVNVRKGYPRVMDKTDRYIYNAFKAGAKWQKENLWKPADDDDLPEIDREVIALTQPYPNDEHLRVVFAHRPNKYAKVWNSDLGEDQVVEIERHGKGEWNIPNVKYWLDVELQNMED